MSIARHANPVRSALLPLLLDHVRMARPDHWIKNLFVLPGIALGLALSDGPVAGVVAASVAALIATCLLASANYTINEWLDAKQDCHHPVKSNRPAAMGRVTMGGVMLQYALLAVAGLAMAALVNSFFVGFAGLLLAMGLVYNVPPARTKDRTYLDVLSESINNPIRLLLGWSVVVDTALPPASAVLAYWMGGAYLMAIKRLAEYNMIGDPARAARYRRSFRYYTSNTLLVSAFFYAITSAFFLAIFLIKYRNEFLLAFPLFSALFAWYLVIGLKKGSAAEAPEKLYRETRFLLFNAVVACAVVSLFFVDIPWLQLIQDVQPVTYEFIRRGV